MVEEIAIPTTAYSVFAPIFLLTRACCFLPVKIRSNSETTTISWSWIYHGLGLVAFAASMTWIFIAYTKNYAISDVYNIRLLHLSAMVITILEVSYLVLSYTVATFVTPFTFKHLCIYLSCLSKADHLLKRSDKGDNKKYTLVLILTLTLTIIVIAFDMSVWWKNVYSKHVDIWIFLLRNVLFYCTYFLVMVIEMNYWYLVQMINVRLANLNDTLAEKYKQYKSSDFRYKMVEINRMDMTIDVLNESHLDMFARNISNITKIYELLFEANEAVNDYYGLNILIVIIGCLIHLIVTPYDLYLELKFHNYTFIFSQCCWMVAHTLRLLLVVEPCHTATQRVKRTSTLVCQFLSLNASTEVHCQLEILATQLFHCPLQYTAYDLMTLDRSLLTTIAGGVTTYLIILFQSEH